MDKAKILISKTTYGYAVKVEGRANMESCSPLKTLGDSIVSGAFLKLSFDMELCQWMDSTFMGTLAMLGLRAKKAGIVMELHKADQKNRSLLTDLGIEGLFVFKDDAVSELKTGEMIDSGQENSPLKVSAEMILKAHETLVEVDKANEQKFGKVIEMVKKDIEASLK